MNGVSRSTGRSLGLHDHAAPRRRMDPGRTGRFDMATALGKLWRNVPMFPVVVIVILLMSFTVDGFATLGNFQNVARQLPVILVAVAGQTIVLLIGGIDLSIGATIGLASVLGASVMQTTGSITLGLFVCIGVGALVGCINGFGIAHLKVQPFIMTFGMMLVVRALAMLFTGGRSMGRLPPTLLYYGRLNVLGIPLVFILGLLLTGLVGYMLRKTIFGQNIYLFGSNPLAARYSGIDVKRLEFRVYVVAGMLAGLAAFLFMMRLGAATPTAGDPLLLQVIGAAVLGGTLLTGGEGGIVRSVIGCILIVVLNNWLEIIGAQFWDQMIVIGMLIAVGSAFGTWLGKRRSGR